MVSTSQCCIKLCLICLLNSLLHGLAKKARAAVMAKAVDDNYVTKSIEKSKDIRSFIYNAIKTNMLFRSCSEEELCDLVGAFDCACFDADSVIIQQGDEGERFFVVQSGTLDISVSMKDNSSEEMKVGVPYESGAAFGELALMYGSPRAATIRARTSCKLWFLDRIDYRGITGQHKLKLSNLYVDFLSNVSARFKFISLLKL